MHDLYHNNVQRRRFSTVLAEVLKISRASICISDLDNTKSSVNFESFVLNVFCPDTNVAEEIRTKILSHRFLKDVNYKCYKKNIFCWVHEVLIDSCTNPVEELINGIKVF